MEYQPFEPPVPDRIHHPPHGMITESILLKSDGFPLALYLENDCGTVIQIFFGNLKIRGRKLILIIFFRDVMILSVTDSMSFWDLGTFSRYSKSQTVQRHDKDSRIFQTQGSLHGNDGR
ncbi:hypothetical protein EBB54_30250 [Schaedlerella arabinosiphila]|uniref:Uncharacterized protein n=1 Tax=Schaedlerella arabinosiphila TaxID=2044587 RepID=A0A426DBH9_9FIRM|nr:hypothetical protein EBB54_30250 [Schaedlerella arabinosiphila]